MNKWPWLDFGSDVIKLSKSEKVFSQGAPVQNMYLIVSGRVKLTRHSLEGEETILHVATSGELLAEASFFSDVYHCSAIVDHPCKLRSVNRDLALDTLLSQSENCKNVMRLLASQVRDLRGLHEIRNIRSANKRILAFLKTLADNKGEIRLEMSLRDMAYKLGLAHETLYRALSELEKTGQLSRPSANHIVLKISFNSY